MTSQVDPHLNIGGGAIKIIQSRDIDLKKKPVATKI